MTELSAASVIVVPLILLTFAALYLLRLGTTASQLTEAARQRLAGFGMLLLGIVTLACLASFCVGLNWFARILKWL